MITTILTCEHAGNQVPARYRELFRDADEVRASHRGWDPGAFEVGLALSRALRVPYIYTRTTRLLVDPNRTRDDRGRFSEFTRGLSRADRGRILADHYDGHWNAVVERIPPSGRILHIASHSFTPVLHGRLRDYEVGLLYDPDRPGEAAFVRIWRNLLLDRWRAAGSRSRRGAPTRPSPVASGPPSPLRVRLNLPYRGWSDGMTTALRGRYGSRYLGIELECNQGFLSSPDGDRLRAALAASLPDAVAALSGREPEK